MKCPRITSSEVVRVMLQADWHTYQVLTKRSGRMRKMLQTSLQARGRCAADLVGSECREPSRRSYHASTTCVNRRPPLASSRSSHFWKTSGRSI